MSYSLFDSIKILHQQLEHENLDIHRTQEELALLVRSGRDSSKLRIITQFLNMLEVLARVYEYEDASQIAQIKNIIKQVLSLIFGMASGGTPNKEGIQYLQVLSKEIKNYLVQKLGDKPFLYDVRLFEQFTLDMEQDIMQIRSMFQRTILPDHVKNNYDAVMYYLNKLHERIDFIQIQDFELLIQAFKTFIIHEYNENRFTHISQHADFNLTLEYFERRAIFFRHHGTKLSQIVEHLEENNPQSLVQRLLQPSGEIKLDPKPLDIHETRLILSDEEISALMDEQTEFNIVSFDDESTNSFDFTSLPTASPQELGSKDSSLDMDKYLLAQNKKPMVLGASVLQQLNLQDQEDYLVRAMGRLFQKQDELISFLDNDVRDQKEDDIKEIQEISKNLRDNIIQNYYVSISAFLGQNLRDLIYKELNSQDKRIRLGIRGEHCEILRRDMEFVKEIVFHLVKNSLQHSIETLTRRKAVDKNPMAWLFIEFDDSGDDLNVYIRDDGRGVLTEAMKLGELSEKIAHKKGSIKIDHLENEYLKVHVQLPMKKIMRDSLLLKMGEHNILIPNRIIRKILVPQDAAATLRDNQCFGQVNLASVLELGNIPAKLYLLCEYATDRILVGVDRILYRWDAFTENLDTDFKIPCVHQISILKDGELGFIVNEKELFQRSKRLIMKRTDIAASVQQSREV